MFHIKANEFICGIEENTIYEDLKRNVSPTVGPKESFMANVERMIRQYQQRGYVDLIFNDKGTDRFKTARWRDIIAVLRDEKIQGLKSKILPNMHTLTIVDEAHSLIKPYDEEKQQIIPYGSKGNWFEKVGPQAYYIIYANKISVFLQLSTAILHISLLHELKTAVLLKLPRTLNIVKQHRQEYVFKESFSA